MTDVTLLNAGSVQTDPGAFTGSSTSAYTLTAGTDQRMLFIVIDAACEFGSPTPATITDPDALVVTYGGLPMTVRSVGPVGFGLNDSRATWIASLSLDGVTPASTTISITTTGVASGDGGMQLEWRPFLFDNVKVADANACGSVFDSGTGNPISLTGDVADEGDLIITIATTPGGQPTLGDDDGYTVLDEWSDLSPSGGGTPYNRMAYSMSVAGEQTNVWTTNDSQSVAMTVVFRQFGLDRFNCTCDDEVDYETLGELRARLMVRLGFAVQAASPPPGMAALLNDFLVSAQRSLYTKYQELRTARVFSWTMEAGLRFYDYADNIEDCDKTFNPRLPIEWVGVEDLNGQWYELRQGIRPENYTSISWRSLPAVFNLRQCIEVFPAPDAAYTLRVIGQINLLPFAADDDQTTLDSELVFLHALARAKNHYRQPDAADVADEAKSYRMAMTGNSHGKNRYIPKTVGLAVMPRPVFLPLV